MSVFDKKNENKENNKVGVKKTTFAFIENIDDEKAQSLEKLLKKPNQELNQDKKSRARGRPKLLNKKEKIGVWVYLTEEQKQELEIKAKEANLSVSKFITIKLFGLNKVF